MTKYSSEYFIPIESYPIGVSLKCNNNMLTNGKINIYNHNYNEHVS